MRQLKDLLLQIREQAQEAIRKKRLPPPTSAEVEDAGEFLLAYREFWKKVETGGSGTPNDIVELWWRDTFGKMRPVTYLGFALVNDSINISAQHQGAQTAYFTIFASGINDILWPDQVPDFLQSIETNEYEGSNLDLEL